MFNPVQHKTKTMKSRSTLSALKTIIHTYKQQLLQYRIFSASWIRLKGIFTHSSDAALESIHHHTQTSNTSETTVHSLFINVIYRTNLTDGRPCSPRHCCRLVTSDKGEQGSHLLCSLVWLVVLACSVAHWSPNERTGSSILTWADS